MASADWSRDEVESVVDDYLAMLASELAGTPYNKTVHRKALQQRLNGRSEQALEFKHQNISAALRDAGLGQTIRGYKPRSNYQGLLAEVLTERFAQSKTVQSLALAEAEAPITVPEVDDILAILTAKPVIPVPAPRAAEVLVRARLPTHYVEREARNRSLGLSGELFILNYERARLIAAGRAALAHRIEHTSVVRGDHEGYDILSFDASGSELLIEVKTTKYAAETPFFVSRHELAVSERHAPRYELYRLFSFREGPRLFTLPGAIDASCRLEAATYSATPA